MLIFGFYTFNGIVCKARITISTFIIIKFYLIKFVSELQINLKLLIKLFCMWLCYHFQVISLLISKKVCTFLWLLQGIQIVAARKTIFPFSRCPEKVVFPKKLCWNMIFLAFLGKMIFLFPENMILYLRRKMKDDFSQKIHGNIFSSNFLKRWSSQKWRRQHMIFLFYLERWYFFLENMISFPWEESERQPFSGNTWKYDIFCVHVLVLQTLRHAPPSKKNQRWSYPAKIHLKVIEIPDWHPTKSSSNSLYFHGDLCRRFHALLSSEEKHET